MHALRPLAGKDPSLHSYLYYESVGDLTSLSIVFSGKLKSRYQKLPTKRTNNSSINIDFIISLNKISRAEQQRSILPRRKQEPSKEQGSYHIKGLENLWKEEDLFLKDLLNFPKQQQLP